MKTRAQLQKLLKRKLAELNRLYRKHRTTKKDENGRPFYDMPTETFTEVMQRNDEIRILETELEKAMANERYLQLVQQNKQRATPRRKTA